MQPDPAALAKRVVGLLEALWGGTMPSSSRVAALVVAEAVERLNDLLAEFRPFLQDRLDNVDRRLGKTLGGFAYLA